MKTILTSVILLISMCFIACKKETTTNQKTTAEKLLGKWQLVTTVTNDFYNGLPHRDTIIWSAGDYIDFRIDGKVYGYENGSFDTTLYGIINNSKLWITDVSYQFDIKKLTDADLQLYRKDIYSPTEYSEATATAKR